MPARRHGEPSIFEKAILDSTDSDEELEAPREQLDAKTIHERLALRDVQVAADVLGDLHRETNGRDGFVAQMSPELAHDITGTLAEVRDYWRRLDRPNVMIRIPGTPEGVRAIEQAIYEGINVNVTSMLAVSAYEAVAAPPAVPGASAGPSEANARLDDGRRWRRI